jgi:hypothetical protein
MLEPRCKVGDLNRGSSIIGQCGDQYRSVPQVFLLRGHQVRKLHLEQPARGRAVRDLEQAAEHGITVQAGQTTPDNSSPLID